MKIQTNSSTSKCSCEQGSIILLPCSGGSNCGQIANQAAVELTKEGAGTIYCLAGVGAHIESMVAAVISAEKVVAIDGCPVACAKKTLEHAGFNIDEYVQVTELGIEKNHNLDLNPPHVEKVANHLTSLISKRRGI